MIGFLRGDADVLVSTSIIESGIDIPQANTLIVERADIFGLSQLYQIRGRVGRSRERAYAYLLYPSAAALTQEAADRLSALSDYTELGAGFKVAMRDLELRGAGSLLGDEQSGHVAALGFELYMQMLDEAVRGMAEEGDDGELPEPVRMDVNVDAYIPVDYIPYEQAKVDVHRRVAGAREVSELAELRRELDDRFGELPEPVENLIVAPAGAHQARRGRRACGHLPPGPAGGHADRAELGAGAQAARADPGRAVRVRASPSCRCGCPTTPPSASPRWCAPRTFCWPSSARRHEPRLSSGLNLGGAGEKGRYHDPTGDARSARVPAPRAGPRSPLRQRTSRLPHDQGSPTHSGPVRARRAGRARRGVRRRSRQRRRRGERQHDREVRLRALAHGRVEVQRAGEHRRGAQAAGLQGVHRGHAQDHAQAGQGPAEGHRQAAQGPVQAAATSSCATRCSSC